MIDEFADDSFEIRIKGHEPGCGAEGLLKGDGYRKYDVVLFTNSDREPPRFVETHAKDHIWIPRDDCEEDNEKYKWKAMTLEDMQNVLKWTEGKNRICCCCHKGVSRSSATAYVVASRVWGPEAALSILRPYKHWPNRLIVHLGAVALGDRKVWDMFVKWQKKGTGVDVIKDFDEPWNRLQELPEVKDS
jgi:predicted protein tyrosine phosphatase